MAFDAFLDIEGLKGESTRTGFEGQTEIYSFSWGASNPTTVGTASGGSSGGKASLSSFNFMKKTDKITPSLFGKCCLGKSYDSATVTLNKATGEDNPLAFVKYKFKQVYVDSIQWSGSSGGDDTPTESCSFSYGQVEITYTPQVAGGGPGDPVSQSYDLTKATA